jgi:hypothetical protein
MGREHGARRNKEHKEPEDEAGDDRRGTAESAFAEAHHLDLIDLVGYIAGRFTPTFRTVRCSPLTKGRRQ